MKAVIEYDTLEEAPSAHEAMILLTKASKDGKSEIVVKPSKRFFENKGIK